MYSIEISDLPFLHDDRRFSNDRDLCRWNVFYQEKKSGRAPWQVHSCCSSTATGLFQLTFSLEWQLNKLLASLKNFVTDTPTSVIWINWLHILNKYVLTEVTLKVQWQELFACLQSTDCSVCSSSLLGPFVHQWNQSRYSQNICCFHDLCQIWKVIKIGN